MNETAAPLAPLVRGWPIAGVAWQMRVDPLGTMTRAMNELGDVIRLKLGPFKATLFRNPDHINEFSSITPPTIPNKRVGTKNPNWSWVRVLSPAKESCGNDSGASPCPHFRGNV